MKKKCGITYDQIEEMIETGNTEKEAKAVIIKKFNGAKHKRKPIPTYIFDRKNYLLEMEE